MVSAQYLADDAASSTPFHWPVSAQLFLPESWVANAKRRKRTHVPADIGEQSKPAIALSLLDRARAWGVPIEVVVVDAGDARQSPLPARAGRAPGALYVCRTKHGLRVRLPDEVQTAAQQIPTYGGRGQPRKPRPAPLYSVQELIDAQPASAWQTIGWREGTKGIMQAQVLALRVHWATGSPRHSTSHSRVHTGPDGWVLAERPAPAPSRHKPSLPDTPAKQEAADVKEAEETKYWFSSLPPETELSQLVTLAHARWVIEQFYARCQAGMWPGRLPGTTLGWVASASGSGHVGV